MSEYDRYYHRMPDGTIKQISPFSKTEVWCVPERGRGRRIITGEPLESERIHLTKVSPENYCHFCESEGINCCPEKTRVVQDRTGRFKRTDFPDYETVFGEIADFRRVGNLFEIVTYDYWQKNYGYVMPEKNRQWMEEYVSTQEGYDHVMNMLEIKLSRIGIDYTDMRREERLERAEPFFGGSHELIIPKRHYKDGARFEHELCASGSLTEEEHFEYIKLTVETIDAISIQNDYVRYVSVFQNWLRPAGASFNHLHRQLVGLDEWGVQAHREVGLVKSKPNIYNEMGANFAIYNGLLIAENDSAMAFAEIGHRFPTIAVYSKSKETQPGKHSPKEIRGMSDILHAVHATVTENTSCNEEWFYAPFDCIYKLPWRILVKLRLHTPAGFEGNTKIYINPISPRQLTDEVVVAMLEKRNQGLISKKIRIGDEVARKPNPLKYYLNARFEESE